MMEFTKLFSQKRLGREEVPLRKGQERNEFQVDYDRIVFSEAFRRLQNKTQVIPLPESDFIHTRLTHSIESSCVGRSLGNLAAKNIISRYGANVSQYDIEALVSAACLAHDIGNPPFGHSGEDAISSFFKSDQGSHYLKGLNELQKADLCNYEGNAAGFHLLTYSHEHENYTRGGIGLTYSLLGVFTKYPKESLPLRSGTDAPVSEKNTDFFRLTGKHLLPLLMNWDCKRRAMLQG